jgi:hypothetical protein
MHTPSGLLQTTVHVCLKVTHHNLIFRYIKKCIFFIKYFVCYCKATVHFDHKQRHENFTFETFGVYKTTVHVGLSYKYQNFIFSYIRLFRNHCASRLERNISNFILSYINKYIYLCRKYTWAIENPL